GRLMDLDPESITHRIRELNVLAKDVKALDPAKLSADERADARILVDGIALELLYLEEIKEWTWDPQLEDSFPFYDPREYVGSRLSALILGNFTPVGQGAKRTRARI